MAQNAGRCLQQHTTPGYTTGLEQTRSQGTLMKTRITEMLGIEHPIIQGGMAWTATAELAVAVS